MVGMGMEEQSETCTIQVRLKGNIMLVALLAIQVQEELKKLTILVI